jgi:CMP-N-acetylneuraminic acid synthetase
LRILGITLARGGSKSVPKKNIRLLAGLPLIAHTINQALLSKYLDKYIVSTDDEEIRDCAIRYGAEAPFLRPPVYATDDATSVSALQHAVEWIESREGFTYDYVVELMATNPLKNYNDIDSCIEKLIRTGADSVIAVHKLEDHHPARIKKIVEDRIEDFCVTEKIESRRQDLRPEAYVRSGAIYALRRNHLMVDGRRYGSTESRPYILPPERSLNIDCEVDFLVAENLLPKSLITSSE